MRTWGQKESIPVVVLVSDGVFDEVGMLSLSPGQVGRHTHTHARTHARTYARTHTHTHTHTTYRLLYTATVLFFSRPRSEGWPHHGRIFPFIPVLCHSDWLFHGESCPRLDVVHPGRAWPSSPSYTWHCSLHYLFLQATPLFPHGVTIIC